MTNPSTAPPSEVSECQPGDRVGYLISRVGSTMSNMVTQRTMAELGITSQQGSILFMLASEKCRLSAELAREYGVDAGGMSRLIDRLEKRGLLTRTYGSKDRRVVRLVLTPEGQAIAARMPRIFNGVQDNVLSGLTPDEVGVLRSMLHRVLVSLRCPASGRTRDAAISSPSKSE